jgi:DNA polymerase III epsilon subunit-like protein
MIIVDVETSGLDPSKNAILSIGAIDFFNMNNMFYGECRLHQSRTYTPTALHINGFKIEDLADPKKMSLEKLMQNFLDWCGPIADKTITGMNPNFDRLFIQSAFSLMKSQGQSSSTFDMEPFGHHTVDLHSVAYIMEMLQFGQDKVKLKNGVSALSYDKILARVGLPPEPYPHNALIGALYEAELLHRLLYGKKYYPHFDHYPIQDLLNKAVLEIK